LHAKDAASQALVGADDRSSADPEPLGDRPFAQALSPQGSHLRDELGHRLRASVGSALLSGLRDAGPDSVAEDTPFEFGEYGKHAGQGPSAGRGEVERFIERDESNLNRR
jgi:hypothetical protein